MAEVAYDLVIIRHNTDKPVDTLVHEVLRRLDKTGDTYLEYKLSESLLFTQHTNAVLESLTQEEGEKVQQQLRELGIETQLKPASKQNSRALQVLRSRQAALVTISATKKGGSGLIDRFRTRLGKPQEWKPGQEATLAESLYEAIDADASDAGSQSDRRIKEAGVAVSNKQPAMALAGITTVLALSIGGFFAVGDYIEATQSNMVTGKSVSSPEQSFAAPTQKLAALSDAGNVGGGSGGVKGRAASRQQQAEVGAGLTDSIRVDVPPMSEVELHRLKEVIRVVKDQGFNDAVSKEYATLRKKLDRLLELSRPDLALVFAETANNPYTAALLVLRIAQSEQNKKRSMYHDDIVLTMKSLLEREDSKNQWPMLTAALSQIYAMANDLVSAQQLLDLAIQEAGQLADGPDQNVDWLSRMVINHQHFGHARGEQQLLKTLAELAAGERGGKWTNSVTTSNIFAHLSALSIRNNDRPSAIRWLRQIPEDGARQSLLAYLNEI